MTKVLRAAAALLALAAGGAYAKDLALVVRTTTATVQNNNAQENFVFCNANEVATGGGVQISAGGGQGFYITATKPYVSATGKVTGWDAIVTNTSGSDQPTTWYAICQH